MSMCLSTAQALTKSAPRGSQALGLQLFHCEFSHKRAFVEIWLNSFLRGPCVMLSVQVLNRRSCGDAGEILSKRSLPMDLADAMS